jgi:hypothetical protein
MDSAEPTTRLSRFTPTARKGRGLHAAFKDPTRLSLVAAAVLLLAGSALSWAEIWLPVRGWFDLSSFEGANDGGIILELSLVLFAIAWSERAWNSRLAILVAAPAAIGIIAVIDLRIAGETIQAYIDSLWTQGGHGYLLPGFFMTIGGATLAILAGVVRIWRARRETRWTIGIRRTTLASIIGGGVGAVVGFASGVTLGQHVTAGGSTGVTGSLLILFAIGFGFAGTWLGAWAGGLVGSLAEQP